MYLSYAHARTNSQLPLKLCSCFFEMSTHNEKHYVNILTIYIVASQIPVLVIRFNQCWYCIIIIANHKSRYASVYHEATMALVTTIHEDLA